MLKNRKGFTLVEIMVTITVASILLVIGVPSLVSIYEGVRANSNVDKIHNIVTFSRSQAISYGSTVNICPYGTATSCGTDWGKGIRVYLNSNDVLRVIDSFNSSDKVTGPAKISGNANGAHITFSPEGLSSGGDIIYCPDGKTAQSKSVSITSSGKVSYGDDGKAC
ncbi:GspH/FimT family pseudopilin [Shewanella gaetbuli]|uniref:Type II secretion system protein H n=1 Tax=Shewanella gaetbuli TaxID=220752 RepID=A0A9X1ZL41_9GAMM|nr:GspH/FimT family pseudopilin [Shewanella gaetbuli]MCL1141475.1 GspH/FimT family pseudopilin [Shewanella gaetbuli]